MSSPGAPNLTPEKCKEADVDYVSKEDLFRKADIVTIHVVLSPRSRGLVGGNELALMKPTAYIINTSRGPIIEEAALLSALRDKKIAGAGLDVFDVEPLAARSPLAENGQRRDHAAPRLRRDAELPFVPGRSSRRYPRLHRWQAGTGDGCVKRLRPRVWARRARLGGHAR